VATPLAVAVGEIEPQLALEQLMLQVTPPLEGSLLTNAVTCAFDPGRIVGWSTLTPTCAAEPLLLS
jgi:hypothetical protein